MLLNFSKAVSILFHLTVSQPINHEHLFFSMVTSGASCKILKRMNGSNKTGAQERSITKSYLIFEAESTLKYIEGSTVKDDLILDSKRIHDTIILCKISSK